MSERTPSRDPSVTVVLPTFRRPESLAAALRGLSRLDDPGLPWDLIMGAELFKHYKPDPETYLGAAELLSLSPAEVMMVAAHNNDLVRAAKHGMKTAFVSRSYEHGAKQSRDFKAEHDFTYVAKDFEDLATQLGT